MPRFSSRPVWDSIQIGRHIKYKGLCKLNWLLYYNENSLYDISLHHFKLGIPIQCYCKIKNLPPHIYRQLAFFKYKNQRDIFFPASQRKPTVLSSLFVCSHDSEVCHWLPSLNLHRNANPSTGCARMPICRRQVPHCTFFQSCQRPQAPLPKRPSSGVTAATPSQSLGSSKGFKEEIQEAAEHPITATWLPRVLGCCF